MGKIVFKIYDKVMGTYAGSLGRGYYEDYEFRTEAFALEVSPRIVRDTLTYEIHEVKVSEKVIKKIPLKGNENKLK